MANVNATVEDRADLGSRMVATTVDWTVGICKILRTGSTDLMYTVHN